jgi:uncharacterized surface protein with fasciclin (FAS1) repeats
MLNLNRKFFAIASSLVVLPVIASCAQETAQAPADAPTVQTSPDVTTPSTSTPSSAAPNAATSTTDIVGVIAENPSLSMLETAVTNTGLTQELNSGGPYTIFAPSDEAFAALPEATRQQLMQPEGRDALRRLLTYHVVPGEITSNQLGSSQVQSLEGTPLTVEVDNTNNQVRINNATVTQTDIPASNGVIHVVDQVILLPNAS